MIDQAGREPARFPAKAEPAVRIKIREAIQRLNPIAAVSPAACGGDILFAEEILQRGTPLYLILPFEDHQMFVEKSVAYAGAQWVERFEHVRAQATRAPYAVKSGSYQTDQDFEDNQRAIIFFALGLAAAKGVQLVSLILYDQALSDYKIGGTHSFYHLCRDLHIPCEQLDLATIRNGALPY
jgi:hypothetical protein